MLVEPYLRWVVGAIISAHDKCELVGHKSTRKTLSCYIILREHHLSSVLTVGTSLPTASSHRVSRDPPTALLQT